MTSAFGVDHGDQVSKIAVKAGPKIPKPPNALNPNRAAQSLGTATGRGVQRVGSAMRKSTLKPVKAAGNRTVRAGGSMRRNSQATGYAMAGGGITGATGGSMYNQRKRRQGY